MNPHILKLIEEYGEIKKREGSLESELRHHIAIFTTLKDEPKPTVKRPEIVRKGKSPGLTDFIREWLKANDLDVRVVKPGQIVETVNRQFPDATKAHIGSVLQNLRKNRPK